MELSIEPGQGVGDLLFGMTKAEVENFLGKPEDLEEGFWEDGSGYEVHYYDEIGLELTFSEEQLQQIEIRADVKWQGFAFLGKKKKKVQQWLEKKGFAFEFDDESDVFALEKESLYLWLEEGTVELIQLLPSQKD